MDARHTIRDFFLKGFDHPWMPTALFSPLALLILHGVRHRKDLRAEEYLFWIGLGLFLWTLVEYLLHRFVFHWTEVREPYRTLASGLHIAHHRSAEIGHLILTPPAISLGFGLLIFGLLSAATSTFARAGLLEVGIFAGYLAYEWVHFGTHRLHIPGGYGRFLRRYHFHHHYKEPRSCFGVTTPIWDWVFRTMPAKRS